MTVKHYTILSLLAALLSVSPAWAKSIKVAVSMPQTQQTHWSRTAEWALQTISAGQTAQSDPVELQLVWYDEDVMTKADYQAIANDDDIVAMIGPTTSVHAKTAATAFNAKQKTLITTIATSTEFQRIYSSKPNVFNLSESDFTQTYMMLGGILLEGKTHISLITSDDIYGQSFSDWFGYSATEMGMTIDLLGIYHTQDELRQLISQWQGGPLLFAPGSEDDAVVFDQMVENTDNVYCSDMMMSASLPARLSHSYKGLAPCADPKSGFAEAYKQRFGEEPVNGEAHLYDALSLVAYAAIAMQHKGQGMNEALVAVIDGRESNASTWQDMTEVFNKLHAGGHPDISGATGALDFDVLHHAAVLYSFYNFWQLADGQYTTLGTYSRNRDDASDELLQQWDQVRAQQEQELNEQQEDFQYPELKDNWALVIGTSDTWDNYRHQADALAIYQLLKRHGYDDDHIVLILADNIANDPQNIYPGEVYVIPKGEGGENVYKDVVVDYRLNDIPLGALRKIILGERSEEFPHVFDADEHSNIFMYWCGHGNRGKVAWGSSQQLDKNTMAEGWKEITAAKKYRKFLSVTDACYSGSLGEAFEGIPGLLCLTAANANEPSKADMLDPDMQIWLSNGFTRAFEQVVNQRPDVKLRDLYQAVARLTTGSHASVYNEAHYGNLFHNSIAEFLPDQVASGISEVTGDKLTDSSCYDLYGRRVAKPTKGLYIKQGKKIIIK